MKIQQAIKQEKFSSPLQKAVLNLLYTSNWLRDQQRGAFEGEGITPQHYNILRILKGSRSKALCPGDVKAVMLDKQPDVTRLVDKLVDLGYVKRDTCADDRRRVDLLITAAGLKKVEALTVNVMHQAKELQGRLTEAQAETLSNLLDKLRG